MILFVEVDPDSNEGVEVIEGTVYLTFSPCLSQDEAEERKDLSLSFRQVNTLDLNSFSFMFYALTSQTINSDATIKFYFNFLDESGTVLPSPVEADCTIEEPVTEIDQSIGVAPASFKCLFNEEYVTDQVSTLQITSADGVAGLPIDDGILKNPKLTDQLIDLGKLTNPATEGGNLPSIINPGDYLVKYNEEQGVFTMVFEFTQGTVNVQADKFFRIPLTYPGGINLEGYIVKKEDTSLTIRFGIEGEINSIPLIWEQTVISFNGEDLFVLPSYKTDSITTKGFSGTYEEEEPNEEHDHGQIIIEDGGNTQGPQEQGEQEQEQGEVIIDDGGNTHEEHGGEVIDDGGERTQEEIIDDDDDKNKPKILSGSFLECDFNGGIKIEVTVESEGPLNSPLNFFIKLKGIEEFSAHCMKDDFSADEASGESNNDEYNAFSRDEYGQMSSSSDSYSYVVTCTAQSPKYGGIYFIEVDPESNEGIRAPDYDIYLIFTPCLSQDEADEKMSLSLSFRQVNTFDLNSFSFMFYALTSQTINSDATIKFYFNFLDEHRNALPSPVEADCTIEEPVTEIDQSIGVAPASFRCLFNEEYVTDQVSSLQITSADGVAGVPFYWPNLINPKLTDDDINEGTLINTVIEGGNIPSIINPVDYLVKYNEDQGVFTMVFEFTQGTVNDVYGRIIFLNLTYPVGIYLEGNIIDFEDSQITIRFGIKGEINALPLIWEQTVVTFNGGEELFVLPAYKTISLTTKGYSEYYEEDEDTDHGQVIIDDGGYTQEEVIIDDGGYTQEEVIIDDGGYTQEEIIIDDGGKNKPTIIDANFVKCEFNGQIEIAMTVVTKNFQLIV